MTATAELFTRQVLNAYDDPSTIRLSKTLTASGLLVESGHPLFADLAIGERKHGNIASLFLDLSDFTGRTFWDDADEVARLADAVLTGFTAIVVSLGGHVLGLRGDGLFAGFGPTATPGVAVAVAGLASAAALEAVRSSLNPALQARGIEPVQARAGIDFGEVVFARSGIPAANEVNIVGFSANFAAKSEKIANAWEVVVGQGFVDQMGDTSLVTAHEKSPKTFTRDYLRNYYNYYLYSWRQVTNQLDGAVADLSGRPLELQY